MENLNRKSKMLLYNGGSLIPNGTVSIPINEDWFFFGIGVQNTNQRMSFLFRTIFQNNNDSLKFNGIDIRYSSINKTLTLVNNGGCLYFLEQHSSLI